MRLPRRGDQQQVGKEGAALPRRGGGEGGRGEQEAEWRCCRRHRLAHRHLAAAAASKASGGARGRRRRRRPESAVARLRRAAARWNTRDDQLALEAPGPRRARAREHRAPPPAGSNSHEVIRALVEAVWKEREAKQRRARGAAAAQGGTEGGAAAASAAAVVPRRLASLTFERPSRLLFGGGRTKGGDAAS